MHCLAEDSPPGFRLPSTLNSLGTGTKAEFLLQPCGGAIPLCMIDEFDLPADIIDRKVTKMKMISPSNREVDVGKTLSETEYIGMCRREVLDDYLRQRAKKNGAKVINSLFMKFERPQGEEGPYKCHFNNYDAGGKVGKPDSIEVSCRLMSGRRCSGFCQHERSINC